MSEGFHYNHTCYEDFKCLWNWLLYIYRYIMPKTVHKLLIAWCIGQSIELSIIFPSYIIQSSEWPHSKHWLLVPLHLLTSTFNLIVSRRLVINTLQTTWTWFNIVLCFSLLWHANYSEQNKTIIWSRPGVIQITECHLHPLYIDLVLIMVLELSHATKKPEKVCDF